MKTIDFILKESGYTKEQLLRFRRYGRTNGMGGKGGIDISDKLRKLKYFDSVQGQELIDDIDLISDLHDIDFENSTGTNILNSIKNFIQANYIYTKRLMLLIDWVHLSKKLLVFMTVFFFLHTIGIKYFKWKFI